MQQPEPDICYGTVPGPRAQMVRLFFYLHLYLAGRSCENPQSARGLVRCKSGPAITWLIGVTFCNIIFQTQFSNSPPPRLFYAQNTLKKISHGKC